MADENKVKVRIEGEDDFSPAAAAAQASAEKIQETTEGAAGGTGKLADEQGRANAAAADGEQRFGGLNLKYAALAAGVAAAVGALTRLASAAGEWVAAANVQERAETKLETTLRNLVDASDDEIQGLKDQAAALQDLTGYGDEQTISAQAMLGTFRLTASQIGVLTPRLLDMAEAARKAGQSQVDLEQLSIALGKAFTDGIGALKRYGVKLGDTQVAAFKLANQSERVNLLAQILDANFKGLAESVGGKFEGGLRKVIDAEGDYQEALGHTITANRQVLALLHDITYGYKDAATGITESSADIEAVISAVGGTVRSVSSVIRTEWNLVQIVFRAVEQAIAKSIELMDRALATVSFGETSRQFTAAANEMRAESDRLLKSIAGDVDDIGKAGRQLESVWDGAEGKIKKTGETGTAAGNAIAGALGSAANNADALANSLRAAQSDALTKLVATYLDAQLKIEQSTRAVATAAGEEREAMEAAAREATIKAAQDLQLVETAKRLVEEQAHVVEGLAGEKTATADQVRAAQALLAQRRADLAASQAQAKGSEQAARLARIAAETTGDQSKQLSALAAEYYKAARARDALALAEERAKSASAALAEGKRQLAEAEQALADTQALGLPSAEQQAEVDRLRGAIKQLEEEVRAGADAHEKFAGAADKAKEAEIRFKDAAKDAGVEVNTGNEALDRYNRALGLLADQHVHVQHQVEQIGVSLRGSDADMAKHAALVNDSIESIADSGYTELQLITHLQGKMAKGLLGLTSLAANTANRFLVIGESLKQFSVKASDAYKELVHVTTGKIPEETLLEYSERLATISNRIVAEFRAQVREADTWTEHLAGTTEANITLVRAAEDSIDSLSLLDEADLSAARAEVARLKGELLGVQQAADDAAASIEERFLKAFGTPQEQANRRYQSELENLKRLRKEVYSAGDHARVAQLDQAIAKLKQIHAQDLKDIDERSNREDARRQENHDRELDRIRERQAAEAQGVPAGPGPALGGAAGAGGFGAANTDRLSEQVGRLAAGLDKLAGGGGVKIERLEIQAGAKITAQQVRDEIVPELQRIQRRGGFGA